MSAWLGTVSIGGNCECGATAPALFKTDANKLYCRACVLAQNIRAIDRRGDELYERSTVARELDAQAAITLHLASPGTEHGLTLPAEYMHVLAALEELAASDDSFAVAITELRERYEQSAFFSPKQMLLLQWRFSKCNWIQHDPQAFVVSTRTDAEKQQIWTFDEWRRKKIAPYLSWQQRSRFGF